MKPIPRHVLKNAVVIVPPVWDLTSAVTYLVAAPVLIGILVILILVAAYTAIPWPACLLLIFPFGLIVLAILVIGSEMGLWLDVLVGRDTTTDQVVLIARQLGGVERVQRIALSKVQAVRIYWRAMASSHPDRAYWLAELALWDGRRIHLHTIEGTGSTPPEQWLARFTRASELLGKPIETLPLPTNSKPITRKQMVELLIKNIKRQ